MDDFRIRVELEQEFFGHQIVLVNQAIHCNQEKVSVWLWAHRNVIDPGQRAGERQLVIVDFDPFHALHTDQGALLQKIFFGRKHCFSVR